jgi:hypothetical protein
MVGEGGNRGKGALQGLKTECVFPGVGDVEKPVRRVWVSCGSFAGVVVLGVPNDKEMEGREKGNVPVLVLVLLVNGRHQRGGGWQHLIDEDEDRLLGGELDALADYVDELTDGQVRGHQVLLLVDRRDVGLLDLLADDGDAVAVFLALRDDG